MYLHFTLSPATRAASADHQVVTVTQPVPKDYSGFAYVVSGRGAFGSEARPGQAGDMIIFDHDGDHVRLQAAASDQPLSVLLIAGIPLNEPVARYGPFVMNNELEIAQAIRDYQSGRMGAIPVDITER